MVVLKVSWCGVDLTCAPDPVAGEAPGGPRRTCATFSLALGAMTRVDVCVVDAEDVVVRPVAA